MRNYENSDTSSFNTYRSGNENPRRENSMRSDYTNSQVHRQGSNEGTADHFDRNSPGYHPNDFRNFNQDRNQQNHNQFQRPQNNWQPSGRQHQDQWPKDYRQNYNQYGNHSQDRDYNQHRSGDRDFFEKAGDRISDTWNRWTDDHDHRNNWNNNQQPHKDQSQGYNQYNQHNNQQHYSSDYGHQNRTNQGRGYDENRYANRRDNYNTQNNRHDDEGVFDRMGRYISNAWTSFTEEEREDQNRANRYERGDQRQSNNRTGNQSGSKYSGPPYNYGSSSDRDYEW